MDLNKKYRRMKESLRNISGDVASRILNVLESEGSAILRSEHLMSGGYKQATLDQILILSTKMREAIRHFQDTITSIGNSENPMNGTLHYIADFGGSKSQFIELINSIINNQKEKGIVPFDRIIPVTLNGVSDLRASVLGEYVYDATARILARQVELEQSGTHAFSNLMDIILNYKKVKDAPARLNNILEIVSDIERISESKAGIKIKIEDLRNDLIKLPLLDDESLLKIVLDIMEFGSKYGVIYILFYDECDEWISKLESEPVWNPNLISRSYFFKQLLNRLSNINIYQVFCFTQRIYEVLRESKENDTIPGIQRLSAELSKNTTSNLYTEIREGGVYQEDEAVEVVLKWLFMLERSLHPPKYEIFNEFLPTLIEKINQKLPRRTANIKIITTIRAYMKLVDDINYGQDQYNKAEKTGSMYISIGIWIEKTFSSYLNYLNYNFVKKHISVGGDKKVDGMLSKIGDVREYYAEIKTFSFPSKFNLEKADQVINCASSGNKVIFFLFCKDLERKFITERFYEWKNYGRIPKDVNLDDIIIFIINEQTLLNCLVGFERIEHSKLHQKFDFFDQMLRLMNKNFHGRLMNLFPQKRQKVLSLDTVEKIEVELTKGDRRSKKEVDKESYISLLNELENIDDTEIRTAVEIINILGSNKKVYTRKKIDGVKDQLNTPILKNSFTDALNYLKQAKIIKETSININFNWDHFEESKDNPKKFMCNVFSYLLNYINKHG